MKVQSAVRATGLTKRYGDRNALDGVDLQIPRGTVHGLLGPNGAGKTTAVRVLTTLTDADGVRRASPRYDVRRSPATSDVTSGWPASRRPSTT